jgi:serine acetyltransferase/glycosyltransferase involved in cell wall biosynthesis
MSATLQDAAAAPSVSVIVATYNRPALLKRLLAQLAGQTLPAHAFEVIAVDDGSAEPVADQLKEFQAPFPLAILRQPNRGPAAARHAGALQAKGEILVVVDDDMELPPEFLREHAAIHATHPRAAVLGRIRSSASIASMSLSERYHASNLERFFDEVAAGRTFLNGTNLCTGNVSFRKADYFAVGGFDISMERSEDAELGVRLEEAGVQLIFSEAAYSVHSSDHADASHWRARAYRYGACDLRMSKKHPRLSEADPWRYLFSLSRAARPLLALSVASPVFSQRASSAAMGLANAADRLGLERLALRSTGVVFGMEYFRGIRDEVGSMRTALRDCAEFLSKAASGNTTAPGVPRRLALALRALSDLRADLAVRRGYEGKYGFTGAPSASLPSALVEKVGLQIAAGYRLMRFFRQARLPLAAKVTSRLLRHLYSSDIHWDAELEPGVMFVHGMGLAVSSAARVASGCILSQNVTIGMGIDANTRQQGAPALESNVHVGPGATLLGPITVGSGSKIMSGVVLTRSVPAGSLVEAPAPKIRPRRRANGDSTRPAEEPRSCTPAAGNEGDAREGRAAAQLK